MARKKILYGIEVGTESFTKSNSPSGTVYGSFNSAEDANRWAKEQNFHNHWRIVTIGIHGPDEEVNTPSA